MNIRIFPIKRETLLIRNLEQIKVVIIIIIIIINSLGTLQS